MLLNKQITKNMLAERMAYWWHADNSSANYRYDLLDPARGLAALAVVIFHRGTHPEFPSLFNWIAEYGEVGANIFFVISGYVIYQSAERHFQKEGSGALFFLKKRVRRIYPPFWISLIFAFLVVPLLLHQTFSVADILSSATLTYSLFDLQAPQVVYWTLVNEQQFYLIMTILILPIFKQHRVWLILASSVVSMTYMLGIVSNWWVNSTIVSHWFEFLLGILVYFILWRKVSLWYSLPVFFVLVITGLTINYRTQAASLFALVILCVYPLRVRISSTRLFQVIKPLGVISYSLYLVHLLVFALSDAVLQNILVPGSLGLYLSGIIFSLMGGVLFYWFFERPFLSNRQHKQTTVY